MRKKLFKCVSIVLSAAMIFTSVDLTAFASETDNGLLLDEAAIVANEEDVIADSDSDRAAEEKDSSAETEIIDNDDGVYIHESNLSESARIAAAKKYADDMLAEGVASGLCDHGEYTHPMDKGVIWDMYNNGLLYVHGRIKTGLTDPGYLSGYPEYGYWGEKHHDDVIKILYEVNGCYNLLFFHDLPNLEEVVVSPYMDGSEIWTIYKIGDNCDKLKKIKISCNISKKLVSFYSVLPSYSNVEELIFDGTIDNSIDNLGYWAGYDGRLKNLKKLDFSGFTSFDSLLNLNSFAPARTKDLEIIWPKNIPMPNLEVAYGMFRDSPGLVNGDLSDIDFSSAKDIGSMFSNCENLETVEMGVQSFGNNANMSYFFGDCSSLKEINMSQINTSNVADMSSMFKNCSSLEHLDVSKFDTQNVSSMNSMFEGCSSLKELALSNFDTRSVIIDGEFNGFAHMFKGCSSLTELDLSSFEGQIPFAFSALEGCSSLKTLYLPANTDFEDDISECGNDSYYGYWETKVNFADDLAQLQTIYYNGSKEDYEKLPKSESALQLLKDFTVVTTDAAFKNTQGKKIYALGKSDPAMVPGNVSLDKGGLRVNIGKEEYKVLSTSKEKMKLTVYPLKAWTIDLAQYELWQNGDKEPLMTSKDGIFNISNASFFRTNNNVTGKLDQRKEIYIALRSNEGDITRTIPTKLCISDIFAIKYTNFPADGYSNNLNGQIYRYISVKDIDTFEAIPTPIRSNYSFLGWYLNPDYSGYSFFTEQGNKMRKAVITGDFSLYAKWKSTGRFNFIRDSWGINNDQTFFCDNSFIGKYTELSDAGKYHYDILDKDFDKLVAQTPAQKGRLEAERYSKWNGSCYGLSATTLLDFKGDIRVRDFMEGKKWDCLRKIKKLPTDRISALESLINYYQLSQYGSIVVDMSWQYGIDSDGNMIYTEEAENLNICAVLDSLLKDPEEIAILNIAFIDKNGLIDGLHSVNIYDLVQTGTDSYAFKIYDNSSNDVQFEGKFIKNANGNYYLEAPEWLDPWKRLAGKYRIMPIFATTRNDFNRYVEPLTYYSTSSYRVLSDNIYESESSADESFVLSNEPDTIPAEVYELTMDYGNFTLTDGIHSAKAVDGYFVSNDLGAVAFGNTADAVADTPNYLFELPLLPEGMNYTVIPESDVERIPHATVMYDNDEKGFFLSVSSESVGSFAFDANGSVKTDFPEAVDHIVGVAYNNLESNWSYAQIEVIDSGLDVSHTDNGVHFDVEGEEIYPFVKLSEMVNDLSLYAGEIPDGGYTISDGENTNCIITDANGTMATSSYMGVPVMFDSMGGSEVETKKNAYIGSPLYSLPTPTKDGCTFIGWFKDAACTEAWDAYEDIVTDSTTLYAGWTEPQTTTMYTVTFNVFDVESYVLSVEYGEKISKEECPEIPGTEDAKWYTDEECTDEWDFDECSVIRDMTLYTDVHECNISFATGCEISVESISLACGSKVPEPGALSVTGKTFCGWYSDTAFAKKWNFDSDVVTDDLILYAKWEDTIIDVNDKDTSISIEILNPNSYRYTGAQIKPVVVVYDNNKILEAGKDYKITYKNNTNACDIATTTLADGKKPQVIVQGIGAYKNAKKLTEYFTIAPVDMKDLKYDIPGTVITKSKNKLQSLPVNIFNGNAKIKKSDYSVTYYTNVELTDKIKGITKDGIYYVIVASVGSNLTGVSNVFEVEAVPSAQSVSKMKVTLNKTIAYEEKSLTRDEAIKKIIKKAVIGKNTFISDGETDEFLNFFDVRIEDEDGFVYSNIEIGKALLSAGKKTMTITAYADNAQKYVGSISVNFTVSGKKIVSKAFKVSYGEEDDTAVTASVYNGKTNLPEIYTEIEEGTDYEVTYLKGKEPISSYEVKNAGTYIAVITGINKYQGTVKCKFTIKPLNVANAYADGNTVIAVSDATLSPAGSKPEISVSLTSGEDTFNLIEGTDFKAAFSNNKKASFDGKFASVKLTGIGNFAGTIKGDGVTEKDSTKALKKGIAKELNFKVTPKNISSNDVSMAVSKITYAKSGAFKGVSFSLSDNGVKISAKDYTTTATEAEGLITITITGKGTNYTGSRVETIPNTLISVSDAKKVKIARVSSDKIYYTGEAINPAVTITDAAGNNISDKVIVTYGENTKVGTGKITVTGDVSKGYIGKKTVTFVILPKWAQWLFK